MNLVSDGKDSDATTKRKYHHGNLRQVLLEAAEAELIERGPDKFSLRGVAKRAGVSHSAPAHHFGDVDGLLTALATVSFTRFDAHMRIKSDEAPNDPKARLVAIGEGYIEYAKNNHAMFDMQFGSDRINRCNEEAQKAAALSYECLTEHVDAVLAQKGARLSEYPDSPHAYWALAHGLANLFTAKSSDNMPPSQRENLDERIKGILQDFVEKL